MESLGLLGLVFDTGLTVTPLMGHLGCLASHWSVPVGLSTEFCARIFCCLILSEINNACTDNGLTKPPGTYAQQTNQLPSAYVNIWSWQSPEVDLGFGAESYNLCIVHLKICLMPTSSGLQESFVFLAGFV